MSILIGIGTSRDNAVELSMRLLDHFHHQLEELAKAPVRELTKIKGFGKAKAAAVVAAIEVGRRTKKEAPPDRRHLRSSSDTVLFIKSLVTSFDQPQFGALYLSIAGWVKNAGSFTIETPGSSVPALKSIFQPALEVQAISIITYEIVPSPSVIPNQKLHDYVKTIRRTGQTMDIKLLDHLLINKTNHFSYADQGLL